MVVTLRAVLAALVASCALLAAACGGGTDSSSGVTAKPISLQELSRSAAASADATSGRFSFALSATLPGTSEGFEMSGEGAFDAASERAWFAIDMSALAKILGGFVAGFPGASGSGLPDFDDPAGWKIELVQDGSLEYVRFPALDDQLPDGKRWIRGAEGISPGGYDFDDLEQFTNSDPREALGALRAVTSDIETVGAEELRGAETTHYRALVNPAELAKARDREGRGASPSVVDRLTAPGVGDIPIDVWIDSNGLVRKLTMALSTTSPGTTESSEASMSFELWDYGEPVEIPVPPASEVADASTIGG